jgi:integrase
MSGRKPRLHLPFANWPEIDRQMWNAAKENDDPFDDGPGARLAKRTLHKHWMGWRRFLGFLTIADPEALKKHPFDRLTREQVRQFVEHLRETNSPLSVAIQIDSLYGAARTMMSDRDWDWLRNIKTRLFAAAPRGGRVKPVITSVQLVDVGMALMEESKISPDQPISMANAVRYRDGLMFALLAQVPLRPRNAFALEIGGEVIKEDGNWSIVIPPDETKTGTYLDFEIPEDVRDEFATYLTLVRPRMLRRSGCKALWVSPKGGPLSYSAFWPVFARHSTERLGIRVTPHDVRDAAATMWAIAAPDRVGISRDLLAHADLRTTEKHYNRAKGIEASRTHARVIAKLRRSSQRGR